MLVNQQATEQLLFAKADVNGHAPLVTLEDAWRTVWTEAEADRKKKAERRARRAARALANGAGGCGGVPSASKLDGDSTANDAPALLKVVVQWHTPLAIAVRHAHADVVALLLEHGANTDEREHV